MTRKEILIRKTRNLLETAPSIETTREACNMLRAQGVRVGSGVNAIHPKTIGKVLREVRNGSPPVPVALVYGNPSISDDVRNIKGLIERHGKEELLLLIQQL